MADNKDWFYGRGVRDDEARAERHELRKIIGILIVVGIAVGLFLGAGGCASTAPSELKPDASLVFRAKHADGSPVALRIFTERPCTDDRILVALVHKFGAPPEMLPQFKAAILTYQGKDWASCWIEMQGQVVSVDEEGAPLPAGAQIGISTGGNMTPHFTVEGDPKLTCSCGCGMLPAQDFMDGIERLRVNYGKPMKVNSAARCPAYNVKVSATKSPTGPHTTGHAIDFDVTHADAHELARQAFAAGYTGIGVHQKGGGRFLHIDDLPNAPGQPRPHLWSY